MEAVLKAIAEPTRQEILRLVRDDEMSAGEIAEHFSISRPGVSQHVRVLIEAGLLSERREGTRRLYRFRSKAFEELLAFLDDFWASDSNGCASRSKVICERGPMSADEITYDRTVRIVAPREAVFEYFVDPSKVCRWMGSSAELQPRPGGIYRLDMNGRDVVLGEFVEVDPPSRVVFTFGWERGGAPVQPGASTVEVTLTTDGDATVVRLLHRDLPEPMVPSHAQGWDHHIERLVIVAAGGDPGPDPWVTVLDGAPSA